MAAKDMMSRNWNIAYRSAHVLGFTANAISMGLPYGSSGYVMLKSASQVIHIASAIFTGFLSNKQATGIHTVKSTIGIICDASLLQAANHVQSAHTAQRYMYEAGSMMAHGVNAWQGLGKTATPP